jgi:sugar phosphate isomerase/epimerase
MKEPSPPIPVLLTGYSLPHATGFLPAKDGTENPSPLSHVDLMNAAVEMRLTGIEVPIPFRDPELLGRFRDALLERGLRVVADTMAIVDMEPADYRLYLEAAHYVGAKVVRSLFSRVLCGRRDTLVEGWESRLQAVAARLREALPAAQDLGLCIAMENHQDAAIEDFLRLADMVDHHPAYGVCLDTGNPLSVGEGPVETARALAPLIRHAHLKDYIIHYAPEGYRLVRCAAGEGVIDFAAILEIIRANGHEVVPGNEVAAQPTRTIPLLQAEWWSHFPPRSAESLLPALRTLWEHGVPAEQPFSSVWEQGAGSAAVVADEWETIRRSTAYLHTLFGS